MQKVHVEVKVAREVVHKRIDLLFAAEPEPSRERPVAASQDVSEQRQVRRGERAQREQVGALRESQKVGC